MMQFTGKRGFTLVEVIVASVILTVGVTLAMTGFVYLMRGARQDNIQDELDIDVQAAMEKIKYHMRLSSLDQMFFHPEGADKFQGISFPLCRDDDGDGIVETDSDGKVIWDDTIIYHVYQSSPNQLRVTTFSPRMTNLSDSARQAQLNSVVANGDGSATYNSTNASTEVVFANLFDWSLNPQSARFDGYNKAMAREKNVSLGSAILSNGMHTFKFTTLEKNASSAGYKIGIDALYVSPSYGRREGEAQSPIDQSGASVVTQYMAGGSWSGNYQLLFPATTNNQHFTLQLANDLWEETNFRRTGYSVDGTEVIFDNTLNPRDFIVQLEGNTWNWYASSQTGDPSGESATNYPLHGMAVRVLAKGSDLDLGGFQYDGGKVYVGFRSGLGSDKLGIKYAYISEAADSYVATQDIVAATQKQLTFDGGDDSEVFAWGGYSWTDSLDFDIDKEKVYTISFLVISNQSMGTAWRWAEVDEPGAISCYVITNRSASQADLLDPTWSDRSDVVALDEVLGVPYVYTRYPTNATYTSGIFDTRIASPGYSAMNWDSVEPLGTSLKMKVRSATNRTMSDASAWSNISAMASGGAIDPGDNRYVQFKAIMTPNAYGYRTPKLKDVTIEWAGEDRIVDIGGIFTKGPDYGRFELKVDGQELKQGIEIDLEIYKEAAGYQGVKTNTSALAAEIRPRNTGK